MREDAADDWGKRFFLVVPSFLAVGATSGGGGTSHRQRAERLFIILLLGAGVLVLHRRQQKAVRGESDRAAVRAGPERMAKKQGKGGAPDQHDQPPRAGGRTRCQKRGKKRNG
jgi:hypothetical protein